MNDIAIQPVAVVAPAVAAPVIAPLTVVAAAPFDLDNFTQQCIQAATVAKKEYVGMPIVMIELLKEPSVQQLLAGHQNIDLGKVNELLKLEINQKEYSFAQAVLVGGSATVEAPVAPKVAERGEMGGLGAALKEDAILTGAKITPIALLQKVLEDTYRMESWGPPSALQRANFRLKEVFPPVYAVKEAERAAMELQQQPDYMKNLASTVEKLTNTVEVLAAKVEQMGVGVVTQQQKPAIGAHTQQFSGGFSGNAPFAKA